LILYYMAGKKLQHIAFIMDGNRRWAKKHGVPTLEGHKRGYAKVKEVGEWCLHRGVAVMTVWAFSTENWKRAKDEVGYLMRLLRDALSKDLAFYDEKGIRIRVLGRREPLPLDVLRAVDNAQEKTKNHTKGTLNIALNYGGHAELVDATKAIVQQGVAAEAITEKTIEEHLYTAGQPMPDLIIRTSERRLSGFLSWQSAYSEIYFSDLHWPEFSEEELDRAIGDFRGIERRFGGDGKRT